MIHRILLSCLALLAWASPAAASLNLGAPPGETYQFTLKYFSPTPDSSLVNTTGDVTLTFAPHNDGVYLPPTYVGTPSDPTATGTLTLYELSGAPIQVTAPPGASTCTDLGPNGIPCPYSGTSTGFRAVFTGLYDGLFLLQIYGTDLNCECHDVFGFDQQIYFPPTVTEDGYFRTGTFTSMQTEEGTLTIALIDPTATGGGGGGGSTGANPIAVPEPAGWALMVGGLGLIGARRRRRPHAAA